MALVHFGNALRGGPPCRRCGGYCFDVNACPGPHDIPDQERCQATTPYAFDCEVQCSLRRGHDGPHEAWAIPGPESSHRAKQLDVWP
jgi:hypothetical protein